MEPAVELGQNGTMGDALNATLQAAAALAAKAAALAQQPQQQQPGGPPTASSDLLYITDNRVTDSQLTTS